MPNTNKLKFDKNFLYDIFSLIKPYWSSQERWVAILFLTGNLLCVIVSVRAEVALNEINNEFYTALLSFNKQQLTKALIHIAITIIVLVLAYGYSFYLNEILKLRWRRWLTNNFIMQWLKGNNHYRLQLEGNIDNPDQRISEDIAKFTDISLSLFFIIFQSVLTFCSFGYILWKLSGSLYIPLGSYYLVIPGYIFFGALLYGALGTLFTHLIGNRLASLDNDNQLLNANFRYSLVRLRDASEQIAFSRGEEIEGKKLDASFNKVFTNSLSIISLKKRLTFLTSGYNTLSILVGIIISIPLFLQKRIQFGGMMQIAGAFSAVINVVSLVVNGYSMIAEWRAVIYRLTDFKNAMRYTNLSNPYLIATKTSQAAVEVKALTLYLPTGKILFLDMHLSFKAGASYLIQGKSGIGKSTLVRALAGIWPYAKGEINIAADKVTMFLPQKPYFPQGTLRDTLLYSGNQTLADAELNHALIACDLGDFQKKLHVTLDWSKELSPGEQQRVSIARILLQKPDILFLDEATSALDEKAEFHLYMKIKNSLPDVTLISIGHRNTLLPLHDEVILLSEIDKEKIILQVQS